MIRTHSRSLRPCGLLLLASLMLTTAGCGILGLDGIMPDSMHQKVADPLVLSVTTPKSVYWPGEAVSVTVRLENIGNRSMKVHAPENANTLFWVGESMLQRYQYTPVDLDGHTTQTAESKITLKPGHFLEHEFMFTRLGPGEGDFELVASASVLGGAGEEQLFSRPVEIRFFGKPEFTRSADGLMSEVDAIEKASKAVDGRVIRSTGYLIDGESGLKRWWVDIDYIDADGLNEKTAFTVDPYSGALLAEAQNLSETSDEPESVN